jgi:hypothetical protein
MNHLETLNEYIDTHFNGNKTEREARIAFRDYRDDVLTSIPTMNAEFIREQPRFYRGGEFGEIHRQSQSGNPDGSPQKRIGPGRR